MSVKVVKGVTRSLTIPTKIREQLLHYISKNGKGKRIMVLTDQLDQCPLVVPASPPPPPPSLVLQVHSKIKN